MPIKFSNFERAPLNPQIAIKSHTHPKTDRGSEERGRKPGKKKKNRGNLSFSGTSFW